MQWESALRPARTAQVFMQEMQGGRRAHDHCIFIEQVKFEGCVHVLNESNAHRIKKDVRSILYTGQWVHGSMGPWVHGSMGLWVHGSMVPWFHGSMVPWFHGSMACSCAQCAHVRNGRMGVWALVRDGKRW